MELHYRLEGAPSDPERIRWRRTLQERTWQTTVERHTTSFAGSGFEILFELGPGHGDHPPEGLGFDALPRSLYDVDTPGLLGGDTRQIELTDRVFGEQARPTQRVRSDSRARQLIMKRNFIQWIEIQIEDGWRRVSTPFHWCDYLHLRWKATIGPRDRHVESAVGITH